MSNSKLSNLPLAGAVDGDDQFYSVQGGESVRQTASAIASFVGVQSLSNTRLAKTAAYTVLDADKGYTIALGGSDFYALTFAAASGYDDAFMVIVTNEDTDRAKYLSISGTDSFYLWPKQSVIVFNQNNAWKVIGRSRWKVTSTTLTINTDFVNGSDTEGIADGLDTGAGAFKTVNYALSVIRDNLDMSGLYDGTVRYTTVTVLMAASSTDTATIHYSADQAAGQFGNTFVIDLNGGTHSGGIGCYYGGMALTIQNGTLTNGLGVNWGASVFLGANLTFGSPGAGVGQITVTDGGRVQFLNNYTISAGHASGYHIKNYGGYVRAGSITATFSADVSFAETVIMLGTGISDLSTVTWALGGHTVTTPFAYAIAGNAVLIGATTVPGSGAGVTATGGQAF